jgi:hypothetical protein
VKYHRGGKKRKTKKQSPMRKFLSVNAGAIGVDWKKVKLL